ncbi:efflux RND transporter periplasmic adaptor subunit [Noviherbaspirillum malthae]|uniref:efflux RND transporter periplasmic adaptor subunit n=1 Tax=Noviherbaspirillum malthae TaxID=1260987 RepID=UPI00188FE0CA|nr:HlyD family efflux transporter periplasmic adaptor subunit [Noviherbaspirillum malthae]
MDAKANASIVSTAARAARTVRAGRLGMTVAAVAAVVLLLWLALAPDPMEVETAVVTRGPLRVTVDNQGFVRAHDKYVIAAPVAAEVERIELHEGDPVAKGQVLATLRPLPLDARQRDEATARLDAARALEDEAARRSRRAEAEYRFAASETGRIRDLVRSRFMSEQAAERALASEQAAQEEWAAARAREQAAAADVRAARAALTAVRPAPASETRIRLVAPVAGNAIKVHEQSERIVAAGTPLIVLNDPTRYEIVVDVLSTDAVRISPGAVMLLENWGGAKVLQAKVRLVEPVAFTKISALGVEEQRVNVIADPVDDLGNLGDGYRIEARVVIWSAEDVIKVPGSSLFRSGENWHVFVIEEGRLQERSVKVGERNQDEAQVVAGMMPGMTLVRFPSNEMKHGMRVRPRSERTRTAGDGEVR